MYRCNQHGWYTARVYLLLRLLMQRQSLAKPRGAACQKTHVQSNKNATCMHEVPPMTASCTTVAGQVAYDLAVCDLRCV
jgi:hypothetical protein